MKCVGARDDRIAVFIRIHWSVPHRFHCPETSLDISPLCLGYYRDLSACYDARDKEPVFLGVRRKVSTRAMNHSRPLNLLIIAVARPCGESSSRRYRSRHNTGMPRFPG